MHQRYLVFYFVCFSIGLACLGVTLVLATRKDGRLARSFLAFYGTLSVLVIGALLRAFVDRPDAVAPATLFAIEYLDTIIGRYGLLITAPLFAHRVFAVERPRRDRLIVALVLGAAALQHVTEYALGGSVWDDRGDLFEDVFSAVLVGYVLWLGFARLRAEGVHRPLADRFLGLLSVGLPALLYDIFVGDGSDLRLYPLLYCVGSVLLTWTLVRHAPDGEAAVPADWRLSDREAEVARLVLDGLSNREIGERLHISTNTVKTHLRAVYDKSGVRSRFGLISKTRAKPANHPKG